MSNRRLGVSALLILSILVATGPTDARAAERVTINLKDGTTVAGQLLDRLPAGYLVDTGSGNVVVQYADVKDLATDAVAPVAGVATQPAPPLQRSGVVVAVGPHFVRTALAASFDTSRNYGIGITTSDRQSEGSTSFTAMGLDVEVGYSLADFVVPHARFGLGTVSGGDENGPLLELAGGVDVLLGSYLFLGGELALTRVDLDDLSLTMKSVSDGGQFSPGTRQLYDGSGYLVQPAVRVGGLVPIGAKFTIAPELRLSAVVATLDYAQDGFFAVDGEGTDSGEGGGAVGWGLSIGVTARWFL